MSVVYHRSAPVCQLLLSLNFASAFFRNEFDAARLRAACERRRQNALLFTHVVHINPAAVQVVYREGGAEGASAVRTHITTGRLMSLQAWLDTIGGRHRATRQRSAKM